MNAQPEPLFRQEVRHYQAGRLQGEISLTMPLAWHVIGYMMLAALLAAGVFLAVAPYARVATVKGSVALDRGVAPVVPSRPGVVLAVDAHEGDRVNAGQQIAEISVAESLGAGQTAPQQILDAINRQDAGLTEQIAATMRAADAEAGRQGSAIDGLIQELASLDRQIAVQRQLVASATEQLNAIRPAAERGFISRRDVALREDAMLGRQQQLAQLEQARLAKRAALEDARRSVAQTRAEANAEAARLASGRAELAQRRVGTQTGRGYALVAPIDGTVTAITARPGQAVDSQQPVMVIVPRNALLQAELYVPTSAAGFLRVGQDVRLAVDAFPYHQFGTVAAQISHISTATIGRPDDSGRIVPVYLVTARIRNPWMVAFGRRHPLLPGMMLSARIVTERQSLFEWLFEPLYAMRNR